jgi:hypothetical protein
MPQPIKAEVALRILHKDKCKDNALGKALYYLGRPWSAHQ